MAAHAPAHPGPARAPAGAVPSGDLTGLQKAAIFILSLEEEAASTVLKDLSDEEVDRITLQIARLGVIDKETVAGVLAEFGELARIQETVRQGGVEQAARLIRNAFPAKVAQRMLKHLESQRSAAPFDFLKHTHGESLHAFLQEEHPQTIALVLSYAGPAKAAEVLGRLPPERQVDIVRRIASLEHQSPEAIKQVESGLEKHLASLKLEKFQEIGGKQAAAEILGAIDRTTEKAILGNLDADSHELAEEIKKLMFVFEDIVNVDDKGVQHLLKEVEQKKLALALKSASPRLKEKIFKNMSQRAADMVKEEIDFLGAVRVVEVEQAQEEIVDVVRRLEEAGRLVVLGRAREDELIV